METNYHTFTDYSDDWYDHYDEAKAQYDAWAEEYGRARLYREVQDENGEMVEEDCLEATGEYPL